MTCQSSQTIEGGPQEADGAAAADTDQNRIASAMKELRSTGEVLDSAENGFSRAGKTFVT